jgi:DNA-binding NtrC family response regulator
MGDACQVLIVDDEPFNLDALAQQLESVGLVVIGAANGQEALRKLSYDFPGILITDVKMPRMDGLELMQRAQEIDPDLPVILVTAYGDVPMAVEAMHQGAYDFIEKPIDVERLHRKVARALRERAQVLEIRALRAELLARSGIEAKILGGSPLMAELRKTIANVADTDATVVIRGETGSGKELVARSLHELSRRSVHRFVPVNCAAMPESLFESELFGHEAGAFTGAAKRRLGKFEYAHRGILFLDEIESMPLGLQVKLLRVLQERVIERLGSNEPVPVDFRLVVATQVDLEALVQQGAFRPDLYYRLDVARVHIPALRERREDIPLLFEAFLQELAARHGRHVPVISREDLHDLMAHAWPGNVRELRNIAERQVLGLRRQAGTMAELVAASKQPVPALFEQLTAFERCVIEQELIKHKGNMQATGQALGLPVRTLNDRMRKHGLVRKDYM